ncbi:MAG TPA: MBL fold metallo-hydrolase [Bacteroidales bacterium]|mgnify:FL=1|nr:MBL fold metallo-hydrolase [Bacteroidales bacterium]
MKITFLGTGTSQGVPVITCTCNTCLSADPRDKRLRSSVLLETDELTLIIDTGPDFRQQMLRENVQKLDAVLITHEHKDHVGGLDDIRAYNFMQRCAMDVYARASVQRAIKKEFNYAFSKNKYPGIPQIVQHTITSAPFEIKGLEILPVEAKHYLLKIFGYRIGNFAYLTDASDISPREKKKLQHLDVLVINALRTKMHYSHYNLEQALNLIGELQPQKAYLTHISHYMGTHAEASKLLPENVQFAFDGLKIYV